MVLQFVIGGVVAYKAIKYRREKKKALGRQPSGQQVLYTSPSVESINPHEESRKSTQPGYLDERRPQTPRHGDVTPSKMRASDRKIAEEAPLPPPYKLSADNTEYRNVVADGQNPTERTMKQKRHGRRNSVADGEEGWDSDDSRASFGNSRRKTSGD